MIDLVNNEEARNVVMKPENKVKVLEILKKFGTVLAYMTEPMVAKLFQVEQYCIMGYGNRKSEELSKYGFKILTGDELRAFKNSEYNKQTDCLLVKPNAGRVRLYTAESALVIGMMLTESKVAEQLREEIVNLVFNNNSHNTTETEHTDTPCKEIDYKNFLHIMTSIKSPRAFIFRIVDTVAHLIKLEMEQNELRQYGEIKSNFDLGLIKPNIYNELYDRVSKRIGSYVPGIITKYKTEHNIENKSSIELICTVDTFYSLKNYLLLECVLLCQSYKINLDSEGFDSFFWVNSPATIYSE